MNITNIAIAYSSCMEEQLVEKRIIPRDVIFGNPDKALAMMSYNGKYISYVAPKEGVLNVWIAPSEDISKAYVVTNDKGRGIRNYGWAYDNQTILFSQDYKGDENQRIYSYNINTKKTNLLTPEKGVKSILFAASQNFPNDVIIGTNERNKEFFDIYRYNIKTGDRRLIFENNKFIDFTFDDDLNLRLATFISDEGDEEIYENKDGAFNLFTKVPFEDTRTTSILGFNKSGDELYIIDSRGRNTGALKSLDMKTGKEQLLASDDKADIEVFMTHPKEKTIQAVVVNYEKARYKTLDKSIDEDIKFLRESHGGDIVINTRTSDDKHWLVAYISDNKPVQYYLYNRDSKMLDFLFSNRKALEGYNLAAMHPVIIEARDGLNMVGYVTYPTINKPEKPVPLVLYVHGGPYGIRDSWGFDPIHQFLANRGYAVLSVNYRGSGGFGKNFVDAGTREFGKKMQDDLVDAAHWAVKQKIADASKIAIMGGSYGGYATLAGLTFTPDLFACGVDIVGMSNMITTIENFPPYWKPALKSYMRRVGDPSNPEDRKLLEKISPLFHAKRIKKPLFIAQGAYDPRVKQSESDQIVEVMRHNHIPVLYALYEDEGHGFARPENRMSHQALTEQFLALVLGGRAEHIGNALKGASLLLNDKKVQTSDDAEKEIVNSVGAWAVKR